MKIKANKYILVTALLFSNFACQGGHDNVLSEQQEAQKEIKGAEREVNKEIKEAAGEIGRAQLDGSAAKVESEKIEATREIAAAKRVVEDEKVEASEEILDAQNAAGEISGQFQRK